MTDKEKIKFWTKGRLFEIMNGIGENDAKNILTDLLSLIDSMQEEPQVEESAKTQHIKEMCKENGDSLTQEPVNKDFEMALAEMIDKAQKCVVEPWVVAAQWKDELIKLAKSEEPVSGDLKEEITRYFSKNPIKHPTDWPALKNSAIHFANWQKEQITKRLKRLCNHENIDQMVEKFEYKYKPGKVFDTEYYKRGIFDTIKAIKED